MAISVSDSIAEIVRNYIRNQEEHHRIKSLTEELEEILKEVGEKYNHDDD
jgi:tRNA nucleotidyltransferase (CCA-adding enzyme)